MILKKSTLSTLAVVLLITSCKNVEQQKENQQLSLKIESALNQKNFDVLDLTKISDKDWDKICIVGPYATDEYVEKQIGFKWTGLNNTERGNDGIALLLFIKNNDVVEYVEHPRNKGDFLHTDPNCLDSKSAKFVKSSSTDGWTYLTKKPQ